ncbi:MAG TPA: cupin domain-containing protein, partial [Rhodobacteraceae bacterium]|nr:cupin domain-containing protein [Paracoccaceae bacterium]
MSRYAFPPGGLPGQDAAPDGRAIFTPAYAFLPAGTMRDIVTSALPGWESTRAWILARPMSGFAESFAQYALEVAPGGGSSAPEPDPGAEAVLFIASGDGRLTIDGTTHALSPGSYAYIPPGTDWAIVNLATGPLCFHWIRKRYRPAPGLAAPRPLVTHDDAVAPTPMPNTDLWAT